MARRWSTGWARTQAKLSVANPNPFAGPLPRGQHVPDLVRLLSVLLDDPVTHFDDLNDCSFLDPIDGLIGPEGAGRQFIISNCDQKLMKLARQKFRNEDGSDVFYRFSDIGRDSPSVEKMTFD